jgi:cytochrome c
MSKLASLLIFCVLPWLAMSQTQAQTQALTPKFQNIGRTATVQEIKAWDIDVRPDFKGLPKGRGSVKQGEVVWEAQCASCHGSFGESSEFFTPIAGGTTAEDIKTGRVKSLLPGANQPQRTTLMKLSSLSTLWDYINRAMPWSAPKSLSTDEVYASTAYILYLSNVLPADFVLSDTNIRDVQALLPNRGGMTTAHSLWPGTELGGSIKPDVQGSNCMANCLVQTAVISSLPEHSRDSHGNLAEQSRALGASRGLETLREHSTGETFKTAQSNQNITVNRPPDQSIRVQRDPENRANSKSVSLAQIKPLLDKNACLACHGMSTKLVGPSFNDIAARYKTLIDASALLSVKIKNGGQGVWGAIPMPAQALSLDEASQIAIWLMGTVPP